MALFYPLNSDCNIRHSSCLLTQPMFPICGLSLRLTPAQLILVARLIDAVGTRPERIGPAVAFAVVVDPQTAPNQYADQNYHRYWCAYVRSQSNLAAGFGLKTTSAKDWRLSVVSLAIVQHNHRGLEGVSKFVDTFRCRIKFIKPFYNRCQGLSTSRYGKCNSLVLPLLWVFNSPLQYRQVGLDVVEGDLVWHDDSFIDFGPTFLPQCLLFSPREFTAKRRNHVPGRDAFDRKLNNQPMV